MVLSTGHLLLIMIVFIGGMGWLIIFLYRLKFRIAQKVAKELGFQYFTLDTVPSQYVAQAQKLRRWASFEWLMVGNIEGKEVWFTQYLISGVGQNRYYYAICSFFETPRTFASPEEREGLQQKVKEIFSESVAVELSESGIFYYQVPPWPVKASKALPILQTVAKATLLIEKM